MKKYCGWLSRYRCSDPAIKNLGRDLRTLIDMIRSFIRNRGKIRKIYAFPHYPGHKSMLYQVAGELGYVITNRLEGFEQNPGPLFFWDYATTSPDIKNTNHAPLSVKVINLRCRDISKKHVDDCYQKSFGLSTLVQPSAFTGLMVEKSDDNATHDGRIITGPIPPKQVRADKIYQRLIDNTFNENATFEYRVTIIDRAIPLVYHKIKSKKYQFIRGPETVSIMEPETAFSKDEIEKILLFCDAIGLELGELDVLRDKNTNELVIVDANRTPNSPPRSASKETKKKGVQRMAHFFRERYSGLQE